MTSASNLLQLSVILDSITIVCNSSYFIFFNVKDLHDPYVTFFFLIYLFLAVFSLHYHMLELLFLALLASLTVVAFLLF